VKVPYKKSGTQGQVVCPEGWKNINRYVGGSLREKSNTTGAVFITWTVASPQITEEIIEPCQQEITEKNSLIDLFIEKRVWLQSVLALLLGLSFGGILSFVVLYAQEAAIANVAYFFFVNATAGLLVRFAGEDI